MERNEIMNETRQVIIDNLGVTPVEITENTVIDSLGADSLDRMEIAMDIEDKFDITIDDETTFEVKTVGELVDVIEKKLKEKGL